MANLATFTGVQMNDSPPSEVTHGGLLDLSKQLRNLILLRPVVALELGKNKFGADSDTGASFLEDIDTHYMVLSALDFMMEETTVNSGCKEEDLIQYLSDIALQMKPTLTFGFARKVAETVIDALDNKAKGYKEFEFDFFDAVTRQKRFIRFRLVAYEPDLEDVYRYRPTSEGYLVYLGMLDMAPEDAQILMEKMLDLLLERGAFDAALEVAKRARKLSLEYRQLIRDRLSQAVRAPGSVTWNEDIEPSLKGARSHVRERQAEDNRMEEAVRSNLVEADDPKARTQLVQLLDTVRGAGLIRSYLVNDILQAGERFLEAQTTLFRVKRSGSLPDLESRLFPQLLSLDTNTVAAHSDHLVSGLYPAIWPKLYDLNSAFSLLLERRAEDAAPDDDTGELEPYIPYPDRFSKELISKVERWIAQQFAQPGSYQLDELIRLGIEAGFDTDMLHFAVIRLYRYFESEPSTPLVSVQTLENFVSTIASGTNLLFTSTKASND